jgi:ABC-type multidrug transport system ATPase subunit
MEEAQALADRVAIMRAGVIVAHDTPKNLISAIRAEDRLEVHVEGELQTSSLADRRRGDLLAKGSRMASFG